MKEIISSPRFIMFAVALLALVVIPLTIIQVQSQQDNRQRAEEIVWYTSQSAASSCPTTGSGAEIKATFSNTEPKKSSTDMVVTVKDEQSGKTVDIGIVQGGETKTGIIQTGKSTLSAGSVTFLLTWADGHSGDDTRTATYKAVSSCSSYTTPTTKPYTTPTTPPYTTPTTKPYVTPTAKPTATPTPTPMPSGYPSPTPTICPTLGPVQNVKIECPNCP